MQSNNMNSELDPWAKMGNMGHNRDSGAVSEENLRKAEKWQKEMDKVPPFKERIDDTTEDMTGENSNEIDEQVLDASRILNYINEAPVGLDRAMEIIKTFNPIGVDDPWTELKQQLGIMQQKYKSKRAEQKDFFKTEAERREALQKNDFIQSESIPGANDKISRQNFEYALEQAKELIMSIDGGHEQKYVDLNNEAISAGMGKFDYAVKDKENKDVATLFGSLNELPNKENTDPSN